MAVEIVMPRVDMDMSSGRMGRWHAAEGAHVVKGATLFEIETDKAAMEVDAPASGVLKFVAASEGDVLPVGACIGWIVADGEDFVPPAPSPPLAEAGGAALPPGSSSPAGRGWRDSPSGDGRPIGRPSLAPDEDASPARDARRSTNRARARIAARGRERVRPARARPAARHRDAPTCAPRTAANIHRLWLQRGEGAPIVFLHGFGADLNGWRPVHRLLPETRPALAIDLPGHGLSPLGEEPSFEALVEAARARHDRGGRARGASRRPFAWRAPSPLRSRTSPASRRCR